MAPQLDGKVALITGAGRGIGRGIALRLARDGADVALVDIVPDGINTVADEIAEIGSKATTFVADVSDRQQLFAAVEHAAKRSRSTPAASRLGVQKPPTTSPVSSRIGQARIPIT
jgi:NAD(P)-dependent dehydrogenase (short-subunit alcohol dehydrogenase family)